MTLAKLREARVGLAATFSVMREAKREPAVTFGDVRRIEAVIAAVTQALDTLDEWQAKIEGGKK